MWSSAWKIFKIIILSNVISIAPNNNLTEPVQMSRTQFWLTFPPKCLQLLAPFRLSPSLSTQMNTSLYFGPEYNNQSHAVTPPVISTPAPRQLVASEINCDSRFTGEITNKKNCSMPKNCQWHLQIGFSTAASNPEGHTIIAWWHKIA